MVKRKSPRRSRKKKLDSGNVNAAPDAFTINLNYLEMMRENKKKAIMTALNSVYSISEDDAAYIYNNCPDIFLYRPSLIRVFASPPTQSELILDNFKMLLASDEEVKNLYVVWKGLEDNMSKLTRGFNLLNKKDSKYFLKTEIDKLSSELDLLQTRNASSVGGHNEYKIFSKGLEGYGGV